MAYRRLGVKSAHRRMMLRNATTSLIKNGKIETTEPRAKELVSMAEKMITLAKQGDLAARRRALAYLTEEDVVTKLFGRGCRQICRPARRLYADRPFATKTRRCGTNVLGRVGIEAGPLELKVRVEISPS